MQQIIQQLQQQQQQRTASEFHTPSSGGLSLDTRSTVTMPNQNTQISNSPSNGSDYNSMPNESTEWGSAKSLKTEPEEESLCRPVGLPLATPAPFGDAHAGQGEPLHESDIFNRPRLADRNRINSPRAHQFYVPAMHAAVEYQHFIDYINEECFRVAVDTSNDTENLDVVFELQFSQNDLETFAVQKELRPLTPE
jgi:hypothetical protein